jgi:hypothetical protein
MDALDRPLTIAASTPAPYVHVDNRALVLHDGRTCVVYNHATFAWISETLRVLVEEGRATRQQGTQVFGGFVHDGDAATLYAGTAYGLITCDVTLAGLRELHAKLSRR